jgi:hypothetical protein
MTESSPTTSSLWERKATATQVDKIMTKIEGYAEVTGDTQHELLALAQGRTHE